MIFIWLVVNNYKIDLVSRTIRTLEVMDQNKINMFNLFSC